MNPNDDMSRAKWNAPSHSDPTTAWLANKGWVPPSLQQMMPKPPKPTKRSKGKRS